MNKLYITFLCVSLLFLCTACVKDSIATSIPVAITPATAMPAGTVYYFYPTDGGTALTYKAASDGSFSGELPLGTYRMLAFNADAEGVEFRNLETFEGASVHLQQMSETANLPTVMKPAGDVYALTIDELVVDEQETVYNPAPVLLTHTLTLNIDLSQIQTVISEITGTLTGAYPSLLLTTGEPATESATLAPTTAAYSQAASANSRMNTRAEGTHVLTFRTLGIMNLATINETASNRLLLTINTVDGNFAADIDVTAAISTGQDEDGELPSGTAMDIPVNPADLTHGLVTITPATTMPTETVYYFYPNDGGTVLTYNAAADGTFRNWLPLGTYRMLAFNADAEGVEFRNLETFEGASVHLQQMNEAAVVPTVMKPAGDVYVLTADELMIDGKKTDYNLQPALLTHTLTMNLDLSQIPTTISEITGTLTGAYPSLLLTTGEPTTESATSTPTTAAYSQITSTNSRMSTRAGGTHVLAFRTLGILNLSTINKPAANRLQLTINTADGNFTADIDATTFISTAGGVDGQLPSGTTLDVPIVPADLTHGPVTITPATTMPAGTVYYFYPNDGGTVLTYNAAAGGTYKNWLPQGTYRVLAINTNVEGVEFRNLETFEGASVHLQQMNGTTNLPTVMKTAGEVYVLTIDEVVVDGQETVYNPTPALLTHTLTLNLTLSQFPAMVNEVTSTLTGAYPARLLATGEPMEGAATTAAYYKWAPTTIRGGAVSGTYTLTFRTLGMTDLSAISQPGTNQLRLFMPTASESTETNIGDITANINITALISAEAESNGHLPSGAVLNMTIVPADTDIVTPGTGGDIDGWEPGNPGSGNNNAGLQ